MVGAGDQAPEFEVLDANGQPVRLAELLSDQPVLLAFFKITCPVCQYTLPFLERLGTSGAVFGISQDDPEGTAEFCRAFGVTFPMLFDPAPRYPASNAYRVTHVPSLFLVAPDGRVSVAGSGFSRQDLEAIASGFGTAVFREGERVPDFRPG